MAEQNVETKEIPAASGEMRGGFWSRALAFLLDLFVLNFFFHGLTFLFREQLFQMSKFTEYLGALIVFAYFFLLNGPVGIGRTIGKFLFNLRVQNYDGKPLSFGAGLRRPLLQLIVPGIMMVLIQPFIQTTRQNQAIFYTGLFSVSLSFLVSNGLLVALHPLKQGFHDRFAGSLVVREQFKMTYEELNNMYSVNLINRKARTAASAFQSAAIAFIVITIIQIWNQYSYIKSEEWKTTNALVKEMREKFPVKGFDLSEFKILRISPPAEKQGKTEIPALKTPPKTADSDKTTSSSLASKSLPYKIIVFYHSDKDVTESQIKENKDLPKTMSLMKDWFQEKLISVFRKEIEQGMIPAEIEADFVESFSLFLYTHRKAEAQMTLPLNIDALERIYHDALKSPPKT